MAQNYWRKQQREKSGYYETQDGRKELMDKKVYSSYFWTIASGILIFLYGLVIYSGTAALDAATMILLGIVGVFFIYSALNIKKVRQEKIEFYSKLPKNKQTMTPIWKFILK